MIKNFLRETHALDLASEDDAMVVLRELLIRLSIIVPITKYKASTEMFLPTPVSKYCTAPNQEDCAGENRPESKEARPDGDGIDPIEDRCGGDGNEVDADGDAGEISETAELAEAADSDGDRFLLPVLLEPSPADITSDFPQKRFIRLERRFSFTGFVPSGLIPRIIARMYSRFGSVLRKSASDSEKNRCFQSSFIQEYGNCTVYVMLRESSPRSAAAVVRHGSEERERSDGTAPQNSFLDHSHLSMSALSEERIQSHGDEMQKKYFLKQDGMYLQYLQNFSAAFGARRDRELLQMGGRVPHGFSDLDTQFEPKQGSLCAPCSDGRVVELRLLSYGHLLHAQSAVVESLDDYLSVVHELLSQYQGVNQLTADAICPICLMKQLPEEECGRFAQGDLELLSESLAALSSDQQLVVDDSALHDAFLDWEKAWRLRCAAHGCSVRADFLVRLPERISTAFSSKEQYEMLVQYLTQDVINPARMEDDEEPLMSETEKHDSSEMQVASAMVQVMKLPYDTGACIRNSLLHRVENQEGILCRITTGKIISGACVEIPADSELLPNKICQNSLYLDATKFNDGVNVAVSTLPVKAIITSHMVESERAAAETMYLVAGTFRVFTA